MGTAVITCCDTPPVLQFAERIFNEMPTFIQRFVERKGCISGFPRRYADRHVKASNMSQKPSAYHHPCYSGFQVQGAAAPPAARWLQYNHFPEICQSDSVHSWLRLQKKRRFATIECLRSAHSIVLQMLQMNCTLHAHHTERLCTTRAARSVPSLPANPAHSNHKSDEFPRPAVPYPAP